MSLQGGKGNPQVLKCRRGRELEKQTLEFMLLLCLGG
jgi:hypothetical protein